MSKLLKILGYIWATPTTLGALILWFLPMLVLRQLNCAGWKWGALEWTIIRGSWMYNNYGIEWAATTLGYNIMYNPDYIDDATTKVHERRHVVQDWILGPLFLPIYLILCLPFGYTDNPFEVDARNFAKKIMGPPDQSLHFLTTFF